MSEQRKNIFGHPSIAKPASQERFNQMTEMLNETNEVEQSSERNVQFADLEQLIYLGCVEDSKTIAGFNFNIRTLNGKEQNDVWLSVSFLTNETKFIVIKTAILAHAIVSVNGHPLDMMYKGKDFRELTKEQRALKVVESWQQPLIDSLYEFYSTLLDRSRKAIDEENIKK